MLRAVTLETIGVCNEGRIECIGALLEQFPGLAMVNCVRRHQSDARVAVTIVIPPKELLAVRPSIFDAAETVWKVRAVFERLEI